MQHVETQTVGIRTSGVSKIWVSSDPEVSKISQGGNSEVVSGMDLIMTPFRPPF
jgi:hypothetical protein